MPNINLQFKTYLRIHLWSTKYLIHIKYGIYDICGNIEFFVIHITAKLTSICDIHRKYMFTMLKSRNNSFTNLFLIKTTFHK